MNCLKIDDITFFSFPPSFSVKFCFDSNEEKSLVLVSMWHNVKFNLLGDHNFVPEDEVEHLREIVRPEDVAIGKLAPEEKKTRLS